MRDGMLADIEGLPSLRDDKGGGGGGGENEEDDCDERGRRRGKRKEEKREGTGTEVAGGERDLTTISVDPAKIHEEWLEDDI